MNRKLKLLLIASVSIFLLMLAAGCQSPDMSSNNELTQNMTVMASSDAAETVMPTENPTHSLGNDEFEDNTMYIKVNGITLKVTTVNNSTAKALLNELKKGDITVNMSDYANMEKVGDLGFTLPRNDEQIDTTAGDVILYQGRSFVIYYDKNSWSLTRIGKIENTSSDELKAILGKGDVTITLMLTE